MTSPTVGDVKPGVIHDDGANTWMEVTTKPNSDGETFNKKLGYDETLAFINNKLGTSLRELRENKAPSHIKLQYSDITDAAEAGRKAAEKTRSGISNPNGEDKFDDSTEAKINAVLKANKGATRQEVIKALRAAKKIK